MTRALGGTKSRNGGSASAGDARRSANAADIEADFTVLFKITSSGRFGSD